LAQTLSASSNSIPFPQHDLPIHKRLFYSLAFGRAKEYSRAARTLAPFSLIYTSSDTTSTLSTLHLESNGYFPLFLENYDQNQDLKLFSDSFKLVFQRMSHLLASDAFEMFLKHLWDCFHHENSTNGFP
jgi:hypothetical protein